MFYVKDIQSSSRLYSALNIIFVISIPSTKCMTFVETFSKDTCGDNVDPVFIFVLLLQMQIEKTANRTAANLNLFISIKSSYNLFHILPSLKFC